MSEKRDAYIEKMKLQLDDWNAEIDKFQAGADRAQEAVRVRYQKQMFELKVKHRVLKEKMADMYRAGNEASEEMKNGVDKAWQVLG